MIIIAKSNGCMRIPMPTKTPAPVKETPTITFKSAGSEKTKKDRKDKVTVIGCTYSAFVN